MTPEERRTVGARVNRLRREQGLTQGQLAEQLGVTVRTIQNYESGRIVPYRHFRALEELGHVRRGWLLDGESGAGIGADLLPLLDALNTELVRNQAVMLERLEDLRRTIRELRERDEASDERRSAPAG